MACGVGDGRKRSETIAEEKFSFICSTTAVQATAGPTATQNLIPQAGCWQGITVHSGGNWGIELLNLCPLYTVGHVGHFPTQDDSALFCSDPALLYCGTLRRSPMQSPCQFLTGKNGKKYTHAHQTEMPQALDGAIEKMTRGQKVRKEPMIPLLHTSEMSTSPGRSRSWSRCGVQPCRRSWQWCLGRSVGQGCQT